MAITNALIKAGTNALAKGVPNALANTTGSALSNALGQATTQALTRGLTGAGMSTLAKSAGSTLDGILGRSSGLILPEPKISPTTLTEYANKLSLNPTGASSVSIGDIMKELDAPIKEVNGALSRSNRNALEKATREIAETNMAGLESLGVSSKSNLPTLNRSQYYDDTLGQVGKNSVSSKDVPSYMQKHLVNSKDASEKFIQGGNDEILRDLFQDQTSPISELYERYEELASGADANKIFTPDNVNSAIELANFDKAGSGDAINQDFADRFFGNKRDITISGGKSPAQNIKVGRKVADSGVDVPVNADKVNLANKIAEMKAELKTAAGGSGMSGGGTPTTTSPDFGGLGESGFNAELNPQDTWLNTGQPINVVAGDGGVGATKSQEALRFLREDALKGLNTTSRQHKDLMGKSRSYGNHYGTVADRIKAENITPANVAQKTEAMLNHIESIKAEAFATADKLGLSVDLNGIDNAVGLRPFQKKQLSELGLNLNDFIDEKVVSPSQAEDIYRIMKSYAYDLKGSEKALEKQAGEVLDQAAKKVSERIDGVLDNMGVDYKRSFLDGADMSGVGADGTYLRKISESGKPFKFSDLRREESDWIAISKTAGNKLKDEPIPTSFTEAIGQGYRKAGDKIKEKIYERRAYGSGSGNSGGGTVPPNGGAPAGGINFTTPPEKTSMLGNLLGKAKSGAWIGAGLLGGMALSGGGDGGDGRSFADIANETMGETNETPSEQAFDPYTSLTIGGYNYEELENGYMAALMAGDTDAAKLIANMIGMLDDKLKRYSDSQKTDEQSSGIAAKQKAALNVLSGLMQNYQSQGPIGGNLTAWLNALTGGGYNPRVAAYDSGAKGSLGTIIKALGDTGALSEGDQKRALELLPKTTDSEAAAKMKYQQLITILKGAGAQ